MERQRVSASSSRYSPTGGNSQTLWALVLLAFVVGHAAKAVADRLDGSFRRHPAAVLSTPRDPVEFAEELALPATRPSVALTLQDAVAQELIQHARSLSSVDALRVAGALCDEAGKNGFDPLLFLAIIQVESAFDHLAISPVGAEGLMQLMPPTARWLAARLDLQWPDGHSFDPVLNVRLGVRYVAHLAAHFGTLDKVLTAYNYGPQATRRMIERNGQLSPAVLRSYAEKVERKFDQFRRQYGHLTLG